MFSYYVNVNILFLWESDFRDEDKKSISNKVLAEVDKWMEIFDCLVIGPGLGRDPFLLVCFLKYMTGHFFSTHTHTEITFLIIDFKCLLIKLIAVSILHLPFILSDVSMF